jgi:hypothetical protein
MYLRVYDRRDSSRQTTPSPSLCHYLTHEHRSIGYPNRNPQSLDESTTRLMYLRVYDRRDSSRQPAPSPSLCSSLTHTHITLPKPMFLTITYTQVLWFLERLTWSRPLFFSFPHFSISPTSFCTRNVTSGTNPLCTVLVKRNGKSGKEKTPG